MSVIGPLGHKAWIKEAVSVHSKGVVQIQNHDTAHALRILRHQKNTHRDLKEI